MQNPEKDPKEWITGEEPMTGPQRSYLQTLCREAGEEFNDKLTKAEASKKIEELQAKTGRGKIFKSKAAAKGCGDQVRPFGEHVAVCGLRAAAGVRVREELLKLDCKGGREQAVDGKTRDCSAVWQPARVGGGDPAPCARRLQNGGRLRDRDGEVERFQLSRSTDSERPAPDDARDTASRFV